MNAGFAQIGHILQELAKNSKPLISGLSRLYRGLPTAMNGIKNCKEEAAYFLLSSLVVIVLLKVILFIVRHANDRKCIRLKTIAFTVLALWQISLISLICIGIYLLSCGTSVPDPQPLSAIIFLDLAGMAFILASIFATILYCIWTNIWWARISFLSYLGIFISLAILAFYPNPDPPDGNFWIRWLDSWEMSVAMTILLAIPFPAIILGIATAMDGKSFYRASLKLFFGNSISGRIISVTSKEGYPESKSDNNNDSANEALTEIAKEDVVSRGESNHISVETGCSKDAKETTLMGVPEYDKSSSALVSQAAHSGDVHAQCRLGDMYLGGNGVLQSDIHAMNWYRLAVAQGSASARQKLDMLEARSTTGFNWSKIFVQRHGNSLGAYSRQEIAEGLRSGKFLITDLAWQKPMEQWKILSFFDINSI